MFFYVDFFGSVVAVLPSDSFFFDGFELFPFNTIASTTAMIGTIK
mgnify:CR=1 FL=1